MICSPEKMAANKANAAQSTGPKTVAGKQISRANAIKHGLTGEGIALSDEDAPAVEAAFNQHFEEMKPKTRAGAALIYVFALCTLRLSRFRTANTAILSDRINNAGFAFDDAQIARRDEAKVKLYKDPSAQLAILSRFEVGVRWVLDAWESLACALESGKSRNWRQAQFDLFEALTGRSTEFPSYHDSTFWNLALKGDEGALDNPDLPGDTPAARCQSARKLMLQICEEEIARWEALLEPAAAATAIARDNAIKAARFDTSKEGILARKYEAATNREMNKALKDFKVVEAEFAEPVPVVETPETIEACDELGSFLPEPEPERASPESPSSESTQMVQTHASDRFESPSAPILAFENGESRLL